MRTSLQTWHARSGDRLPDELWHRTLSRVRGEFAEMPSGAFITRKAS